MSWFFLIMGVVAEALSHIALKATDGFNKPLPLAMVAIGHLFAFLFLGLAMKGIPVGIAHAVWAALAIMTVTLLSTFIYQQHLDTSVWVGMAFVAVGLGLIAFSQGHSH